MDVFMFGLSDLNVLYGNKIHVGAGNENLEEGMFVSKGSGMSMGAEKRNDGYPHDRETKGKGRRRKRKSKDKKKKKSPAKPKEPTTISVSTVSQPPASSTYEDTTEDPPVINEAISTQPPPKPTTDEAGCDPVTKAQE
ncbi:hypothetical protein Hanom_Chr06g00550591 [Helianthus anomalus]